MVKKTSTLVIYVLNYANIYQHLHATFWEYMPPLNNLYFHEARISIAALLIL
ncbi:hypothetical protein [Emticicia sp. 17c]|uniref:hypothetical protein n=1 Tax=Emticicia sp. 17c TaxID=3127704 RepID=UPI00301D4F77